jgi:VanZ family protein
LLTGPRRDVWKAWLAAGLWLALIAIESTELLSSSNTGRFIYPLLTYLFGHIDLVRFSYWHGIGRKMGHVLGYGILSILLFRAWKATIVVPSASHWCWRWAQLAFFMTALVASLDEWHQTFLPSRTGTIRDVFLDSAAALAAQILVYLWITASRDQRIPQTNTG